MKTRMHCSNGWRLAILAAAAILPASSLLAAETVWLDSLNLETLWQTRGKPQVNRSMSQEPLSIKAEHFERGVGTRAASIYRLQLAGGTDKFIASVGLDDSSGGRGAVAFRVIADDKAVFDSGAMASNDPPKHVEVDLHGVNRLLLNVAEAGEPRSSERNSDYADWADARFIVSGQAPKPVAAWDWDRVVLTPRPGPGPRINGPKLYACGPGHPFIYRIPAQGNRPMRFSARGLPKGPKLDPATGIITGTSPKPGEYTVTFTAANGHGKDTRSFKIISGSRLALTPPMGFNDWYAYYSRVTDAQMREAADIMVSSGMADAGYQYVNIDDCWMGQRDAAGNITGNERFPDMKVLADYIHHKGLKAGLYTSPGPKTCAGYTGAWQHEAQDAKRFADWGFDFLKYDWCSYGNVAGGRDLAALQKPYRLMGDLLKQQKRDLVLNLCQYGMGEVWKWGAEVGGHSWRTGGDLGFELDRIFEVALRNCEHRDWNRPGAWNDPDYIQIGYIGNARGGGLPAPCPLAPAEQYAFMSLWCLMAAPLFYSGDMTRLDDFTLNVLCNPEVIAVDQNPLGQCARGVALSKETFLMVKDLDDGAKAVGLFNRDLVSHKITARWTDLGVTSKQPVRDLWRQRDLGQFDQVFEADVPGRGVVMIRVGKGS